MNYWFFFRNYPLAAGLSRFFAPLGLFYLFFLFSFFPILFPAVAHAGGKEFPGGNARSLGRGGASFLRADDPYVMVFNPALLADLPDDMALISAMITDPRACFQPPGAFEWATANYSSNDVIVLDEDEGPLYLDAKEGDQYETASGKYKKLTPYRNDPLPKSCYSGGVRSFPSVALTTKIGDRLGLGIGFFAPDLTTVDSWGNGDGTVDTPRGKRPDITAYSASFTNSTYFNLLGAIGYRVAPWLRFGAGFKWTMVVFNSYSFSNTAFQKLAPATLGRSTNYGKDLFIPGFTTSIHAVPFDALDLALGFRWEDRIRINDFKTDATSKVFSYGEEFRVKRGNEIITVFSSPKYTTDNIPGKVVSPPLLVPQLTFGVRFSDRIHPRFYETRKKPSEQLRDSMSDERWDVEANAIYYFNSVNDYILYSNDGTERGFYYERNADGTLPPPKSHPVGECNPEPEKGKPCRRRETKTFFGGKNQLGLRLGGDINIIPGVFSARAGVSWDQRGINPDYASAQNMNFQRLGLHAGVTVRFAKNTDFSIGYSHIFFESIEVQLNNKGEEGTAATIPNMAIYAKDPATAKKYHIKADFDENGEPTLKKLDGVAKAEYTSAGENRSSPYINAGKYTYQMDIVGVSVAQHF